VHLGSHLYETLNVTTIVGFEVLTAVSTKVAVFRAP
jgi:hypothetical protein